MCEQLSDMRESLKRTEDAASDPSALQLSPWRRAVHDRAGRKRDVRSYKDRAHSAATLIQVRCACVSGVNILETLAGALLASHE